MAYKIPSTEECGLPEKFSKWRNNQEEAVSVMITSPKRVTALSAPTGFGKSATYMGAALLSGKRTCIVTNSRGLQDQLLRDFEIVGLVDLRGRGNYSCDMRDDYSCEEGYEARCPYKGTIGCPSSQAEMRAASSSLVVTNYAKWTKSPRMMQSFEQVIFDEGHDAPDAVASAMQVTLTYHAIEEELQIAFPRKGKDMFEIWKVWARGAKHEVELKLEECKEQLDSTPSPKSSLVKRVNHLRTLVRKLSVLSVAKPDNWVVDEVEKGYQFDPIRTALYAESSLFFNIPRIIIVSATLRPKTLFMLGQSKEKFDFKEFDSDFDRSRCPIYWIPTMRVDSRADDLSMLWVRLDQIASRRRDRKGIIHTISYARRDEIMGRSRFSPSMMINPKGEAANELVMSFKKADPGTILVSPSVGTGYDFPGAECEWQFLCKIPFPDGRSKIIKARQQVDPEYGPYQAMQTMVQTFGRGMRFKNDACENFIGDDHLQWFLPRYGHLAPRTFHSFYRRVQTLPPAPVKL